MNNKTINYYEENFENYKTNTQRLNFSNIQKIFIKKLKANSTILDFGCGTGRDTKFFLDNNFYVKAIDGSKKMCQIASEYCNIKVDQILFNDFNEINCYDGIWACASLLHLPYLELNSIFHKLHDALKKDGILYTSFKLGTFEGYIDNRYFTFLTYERFIKIPAIKTLFKVDTYFISEDIRDDTNQKWLNVFLVKK
jgi:SAM-dependent methyltransferase